VLLVLEATRALNEIEQGLVTEFKQRATVAVINKSDIRDDASVRALQTALEDVRHIQVSAKTGNGIEQLKHLIFDDLVRHRGAAGYESVTPNLRQRKILEAVQDQLQRCLSAIDQKRSVDIISERLKLAIERLTEISGDRANADIYDHIFDQFCIGK
jgi:tRNA modification GTPase